MRRLGGLAAAFVAVGALMATVASWLPGPTASALGERTPHLAIVVFENKEYEQVVGNPNAPYINDVLIASGRLFTHYYATTHPSLPNYLTMTSARHGRCLTDGCPRPALPNESLFHQMNTAVPPVSWRVYAEAMPSNCYPFNTALYAARHNPALYYRDIGAGGDGSCHRFDVPYSHLAKDMSRGQLPQFAFIVPNIHHDMHSNARTRGCRRGSAIANKVCQGDRWLRRHLPALLDDDGRRDVTVLIAFDEGSTGSGGGGHVLLLEVGPSASVCRGCRTNASINHYGLLTAIEDWFGLPHLQPASPEL